MKRNKWDDLTPPQKTFVVIGATVEVVLTAVALADLARRPTTQVRGPKVLWAAGCFVQPVGPVAYLLLGRRTA